MKVYHVYVNGELMITKASAEKAYSAAEHYMSLRRNVWVTSKLVPQQ